MRQRRWARRNSCSATPMSPDSAYVANYLQLIVSRGLRHERRVTWDTTAGDVDALLDCATHSSKSGRGSGALLDLEAECGLHRAGLGRRPASLPSTSPPRRSKHSPRASRCCGSGCPSVSRPRIRPSRWRSGRTRRYGPASRSIDVPTWGDIRGNYPARVAAQLDPLMSPEYRPDGRGQLILWYGEPGHRQDLQPAGARLAVARVVLVPLHHRSRDVLRAARLHAPGDPRRRDDDDEPQKWKLLDPRGHRRAACSRRQGADRPGSLAAAERRRRDHRPGATRDRARHDERRPAPTAPRRLAAGTLPGKGPVRPVHAT